MDLGLKDKRAWVIGASSGIGLSVAGALVREGAKVAVSARREDRLIEASKELREGGALTAIYEPLDVTDPEAIHNVADRVIGDLDGLDILVVNQGGPQPGEFTDIEVQDLDVAYRLLLESAFRLTKSVLPPMRGQGSGTIVYITSTSTKETLPNLYLSNVMRLAIVGMAKSLSRELGPEGIRVLCASPGRISTSRAEQIDSRAAERRGVTRDEVRAAAEASIPLRRYGTPTEFGDVVAFMCSDRASYLSGTNVVVDGAKTGSIS